METNDKKNTDSSLPEIKKIGKAKDLISIIPEIESKNSSASADEFSSFTTT